MEVDESVFRRRKVSFWTYLGLTPYQQLTIIDYCVKCQSFELPFVVHRLFVNTISIASQWLQEKYLDKFFSKIIIQCHRILAFIARLFSLRSVVTTNPSVSSEWIKLMRDFNCTRLPMAGLVLVLRCAIRLWYSVPLHHIQCSERDSSPCHSIICQ